MSYAIHNLALKATHLPPSHRLVVAAMAFLGRDDGTNIVARVSTIAEKAGMSLRQTQRIMHALEGDREKAAGVIVCERSAAGHRTARFRIDLSRLTNAEIGLPEVPSCHPCDIQRCQDVTPRGDTDVTPRGDTDVTPKENRYSTRLVNSHKRAREGAGAAVEPRTEFQGSFMLPISSDPKPAVSMDEHWPAIWSEFLRWPGLPATASEPLARLAWQRSVEIGSDEFLACVVAHGRKLAEDNSRRGRAGAQLCTHPHNWIERDAGWKRYLAELRDAREQPASAAAITLAPEHAEALRRGGFSDGEIQSWFVDGALARDPVPTFFAANPFKRDWIANHFGARLSRAFGVEHLTIALRQQVAA